MIRGREQALIRERTNATNVEFTQITKLQLLFYEKNEIKTRYVYSSDICSMKGSHMGFCGDLSLCWGTRAPNPSPANASGTGVNQRHHMRNKQLLLITIYGQMLR